MTREREESLYRLEKFNRRTNNDGTLTGYPTASLFSSTMNSYVMDLYQLLGMRCSKVFYSFDGATAFVSALLNVNYMFGESDKYENGLYSLIGQSGDIYLYQCNSVLPFGYVAPIGYELPDEYLNHGLHLQNQMIRDLGIREVLFQRMKKKESGDDVVFTAERAGYYYGIVNTWGTGKIDCFRAEDDVEHYKDLRLGSVLYLGYLEENRTVTLKNGDENDTTPKISVDIYPDKRQRGGYHPEDIGQCLSDGYGGAVPGPGAAFGAAYGKCGVAERLYCRRYDLDRAWEGYFFRTL